MGRVRGGITDLRGLRPERRALVYIKQNLLMNVNSNKRWREGRGGGGREGGGEGKREREA